MTREDIERKHAKAREEIEIKAQASRDRAEKTRLKRLAENEGERVDKLLEIGLNPDGSDPLGRPQGSRV